MYRLILLVVLTTCVWGQDVVPGEYMVKLRDDVVRTREKIDVLSQLLRTEFQVDVRKIFQLKDLTLLHVSGDERAMARVSKLPEVAYVEPNMLIYASQTCVFTSIPDVWGLDRIDQRERLVTDPDLYMYHNGIHTGTGSDAYIIDTGVRTSHVEFGGRASWGFNADGLAGFDDNGHGTHCAGIVGSTAYGVARNVSVIAVKVMDQNGVGSTADLVAGCEYVSNRHLQGSGSSNSVANLSLGGPVSTAIDDAVQAMIQAGVVCVVAAGNSNSDACDSSPARVEDALTVGATDVSDISAAFTNFGICVDLFAPGVNVKSTWHTSDVATATLDGTSMAAPYVAGVVGRYQSSFGGVPLPAIAHAYILNQATGGAITFRPGHSPSNNLLLHAECPMA